MSSEQLIAGPKRGRSPLTIASLIVFICPPADAPKMVSAFTALSSLLLCRVFLLVVQHIVGEKSLLLEYKFTYLLTFVNSRFH